MEKESSHGLTVKNKKEISKTEKKMEKEFGHGLKVKNKKEISKTE